VNEQDTSAELKPDLQLEIAHVLLIDVVGYSKLLVNEEIELLQELNQIVRSTECFRTAETSGKFIRLPTGDGMALLFFHSPEEPVRCALEISRTLQEQPHIQVRMGVHSGPVNPVGDVNDKTNMAGAGINVAQRVMDCGDAGHILLSKHVADDLAQYRHWQPYLHDLGEWEVKHGLRLNLVNLYKDSLGNPQVPEKLKRRRRWNAVSDVSVHPVSTPRWPKSALIAVLLLSAVALVIGSLIFFHQAPTSTATSTLPEGTASNATALIPQKSIAVLPFDNLSDEKENAYFADGVQDEVLTALAKVADLKVISRTSVMQYRNAATSNLREIAQQLGVAHVLVGSVQRAGGKVRVNAQLIEARTDAQEWAEKYDRPVNDVFAIQSEIAQAIADQLEARISPREKAAMSQAPTTDLTANKLYVQAKELDAAIFAESNMKPGLLEAVRLLDEAVTRDPRFLLAYCLLGQVHLELYFYGNDHTPTRRELAHVAIENASRLQPDAGDVHLVLALYAYWGFLDYDRARAELDLARTTLPNKAEIYQYTAAIDRRQGRWSEATRDYERAVDLDPRNFVAVFEAARTYQVLRRYSNSNRLFARAIAISPLQYAARIQLALNPYYERADLRPLRAEISRILREEPGAAAKIATDLFNSALVERDSAAITRALAVIPPEGMIDIGDFLTPRDWFAGLAARSFGDAATARSAFTAARANLEEVVHKQPDYSAAWIVLGLIDAGLGRKDEAVREGRRACELLPMSKDAWEGSDYVLHLALIFAWTDEKDLALEQLTILAQLPVGLTYGELKLNPQWDSLRGDPRFEKIVASLAPKE
jgi:serine/threonine-protein kinase